MSADISMLMARRLPGQINTRQTAELTGFQIHDISHLVAVGLLRPLGSPVAANAEKFYLSCEILELDKAWYIKARRCIYAYHRRRNGKKARDPQIADQRDAA